MKTDTIEYKDGDLGLRGYLAYDDQKNGKRPGILVMPEGLGLGKHAKRRAEQLAQLGYVALAGDPFGDGKEFTNMEEAGKAAFGLMGDSVKFRHRCRVALDQLAALPQTDPNRLAMMGYCMGGAASLELARDGAPLRGIVSFHGVLSTQKPAEAGQVKAKILICNGSDDPFVPPEHLVAVATEFTKAGADWQIINYGSTKHGFTNPEMDRLNNPAVAYNKLADERSWKSMKSFFEEIFG
jgi:dienelactone hydrolase